MPASARRWGPPRQYILVDSTDKPLGIERDGVRYCVGKIPAHSHRGIWLYRWEVNDDGPDQITAIAQFGNAAEADRFLEWFTEAEVAR